MVTDEDSGQTVSSVRGSCRLGCSSSAGMPIYRLPSDLSLVDAIAYADSHHVAASIAGLDDIVADRLRLDALEHRSLVVAGADFLAPPAIAIRTASFDSHRGPRCASDCDSHIPARFAHCAV